MQRLARYASIMKHFPQKKLFTLFQKLVYEKLGIHLANTKTNDARASVIKTSKAYSSKWFLRLFSLHYSRQKTVKNLEVALELMTTNETFFFREEKHFEYLPIPVILPKINPNKEYKVWSAASSSGEEPYSIAMLLNEHCFAPWSVVASDVNKSVLTQARKGIYIDERTKLLPENPTVKKYCVKGTGEFEGYMRVKPELRSRLHFFLI